MGLDEVFDSVLEAAKQGAEWAWGTLYREYAGPVTGYLTSRGASEPEDIASDVFLQVARKIHSFQGTESSFRSWLFVITHNRLIDERRSRGRKPDLTEFPDDNKPEAKGGDVESEAVERLVTDELRQAFDRLTDGQRDVLALRMIGGLTLDETAQALGKNVGAVKATQWRALQNLKQHLDLTRVTK